MHHTQYTHVTHSGEDTFAFGRALSGTLCAGDIVLLFGELGAGKSVLARGIARGLGVTGAMPSPTFTLMQPYASGRVPLYHFDLYRLEDADQFEEAGLAEFVGGDGVSLVEWPDCASLCPDSRIELALERGATDDERRIVMRLYALEPREAAIANAVMDWRVRE